MGSDGPPNPAGAGAVSATPARSTMSFRLVGANERARMTGAAQLPGKMSYLVGRDRSKWRTGVATFAQVQSDEVYPGIDVVYYGRLDGDRGQLEYDFVVAPNADPTRIMWEVRGAERAEIDSAGDLVLQTAAGEVRQRRPVAYQEIDGRRVQVPARFSISPADPLTASRADDRATHARVKFDLAAYDATRALIIDPVLAYATYLGSAEVDRGEGVAIASDGSILLTSVEYNQAEDGSLARVTKLNADATAILWSTLYGGSGRTEGNDIALDEQDRPCITGITVSEDLPLVNAIQGSNPNPFYADSFVAKLTANGQGLVFSTYYGGWAIDYATGIATDAGGNVYVTGWTNSLDNHLTEDIDERIPLLNALQSQPASGSQNAFIARFGPTGQLFYSTYFGGSAFTSVFMNDIAVDLAGSAYISGSGGGSGEPSFPTTPGAYQTALAGGSGDRDALLAKLDVSGQLVFCTLLGGSDHDESLGIAVDGSGHVYACGYTYSPSFPAANPPLVYDGYEDAFVVKLSPDGSQLLYGQCLGGRWQDAADAVAVDATGIIAVAGRARSGNFPTSNFPWMGGGDGGLDAFVAKLDPTTGSLRYSLVIGGSRGEEVGGMALDAQGDAWVIGTTSSYNSSDGFKFPTTSNALRHTPEDANLILDVILFQVTGGYGEPGSPSLGAVAQSPTQVDLSWYDHSTNETAFDVSRKPQGGEWQVITTLAPDTTFHQDGTASPGTTYTYRVTARNAVGSAHSEERVVSTPQSVAAPSNLRITASELDRITLAWQNNAGNAIGFECERKAAGEEYLSIGIADTAQLEDTLFLEPGVTYTYRVRAYSEEANSDWSNEVSGIPGVGPLQAPDQLSAVSQAGPSVRLTFTDRSPDETGFLVEWKSGDDDWNATPVATLGPSSGTGSQRTATHSSVQIGQSYSYRVASLRGSERAYSETATVTVTAPPPAITTLNPAAGTQGQENLSVLITGTGFVTGATVSFGAGITVDSISISQGISILSDHQVTAVIDIAPGAATGVRTVTVTNPDGQSGSKVNGFTVNPIAPPPPGALKLGKLKFTRQSNGSYQALLTMKHKSIRGTLVGNVDASLVTAPFSISAGTGAFTLLPRQSKTVTVVTTALPRGTHAGGKLVITSNDPRATRKELKLSLKVKR